MGAEYSLILIFMCIFFKIYQALWIVMDVKVNVRNKGFVPDYIGNENELSKEKGDIDELRAYVRTSICNTENHMFSEKEP